MFDPVTWTHDDSVVAVQGLRGTDVGQQAATGLVASLTSRRLDWRSAVASWAMIERLPPHTYASYSTGLSYDSSGNAVRCGYACKVCAGTGTVDWFVGHETDEDVDLSVLSFERLKWGGVRHDHLTYARFDRGLFLAGEAPRPVEEDWVLMRTLLAVVDSVPETMRAGGLVKELKGWPPGTSAEHRHLVEILCAAGILTPRFPDRSATPGSDWSAAAGQWRGADRYDRERVAALMPGIATS